MRIMSFSIKKILVNTKNRGLASHGFSGKGNSLMMILIAVHLNIILQVMVEGG